MIILRKQYSLCTTEEERLFALGFGKRLSNQFSIFKSGLKKAAKTYNPNPSVPNIGIDKVGLTSEETHEAVKSAIRSRKNIKTTTTGVISRARRGQIGGLTSDGLTMVAERPVHIASYVVTKGACPTVVAAGLENTARKLPGYVKVTEKLGEGTNKISENIIKPVFDNTVGVATNIITRPRAVIRYGKQNNIFSIPHPGNIVPPAPIK